MYNFLTNILPARRDTWRNAFEIKMAALEHEKRRFQRFQMIGEYAPAVIPLVQANRNRPSEWDALMKAPLSLS
ncbi:MAG: hypothetical protein WCE68_06825 [Anaerolineales bacterium]